MSASTMTEKISYMLYFGDGQNSDGTPKYKKVSLGALDPDSYDADKVHNLVEAVAGLGDYEFQFGMKTTAEKVEY